MKIVIPVCAVVVLLGALLSPGLGSPGAEARKRKTKASKSKKVSKSKRASKSKKVSRSKNVPSLKKARSDARSLSAQARRQEKFLRHIRGWVRMNLGRGQTPLQLLAKRQAQWLKKACRVVSGSMTECTQWYALAQVMLTGEYGSDDPDREPPRAGRRNAYRVTGPRGACPEEMSKAGYQRWVWHGILYRDRELLARIRRIASYVSERDPQTTLQAQLSEYQSDFANLAAEHSHPISRVGTDLLKAIMKEAKISWAFQQRQKKYHGLIRSKSRLKRSLAAKQRQLRSLQAQLNGAQGRRRSNLQKHVDKTEASIRWITRGLLRTEEPLGPLESEIGAQRSLFCRVASKHEASYLQALETGHPKHPYNRSTYIAWFLATAEQKKLFDTDPGYNSLRREEMSEPGAEAKARAVRLPRGLRGRGKFGPEMIPFFQKTMSAFRKTHKDTWINFTQYRSHYWDQYSADLWVTNRCTPASQPVCFLGRDKLLALFKAMLDAGRATGVKWRALYNNFEAAKDFNKVAGKRLVRFLWTHGPRPYKDHIHVDVMPIGGGHR